MTVTTKKLLFMNCIKLPCYEFNLCGLSKREKEDDSGTKLEFILLERLGETKELHPKKFPIDFNVAKHLKIKGEKEEINTSLWPINGKSFLNPELITTLTLNEQTLTWTQVLRLILSDFSFEKIALLRLIVKFNNENRDWKEAKIGFEIEQRKVHLYKL